MIETIYRLTFTSQYGAIADANDNDGWTPLHLAAENGQLTTVRLLLSKGAKINKQNRYGRTPLHWACSSNQVHLPIYISLGAY